MGWKLYIENIHLASKGGMPIMKQNKENRKQFVKICIFVVFFIFLIPFMVNLIVETANPFGLGFINDSNKDTWISFFGSIIGGSITLIGVIWTINYEKQERQRNEKKQMKILDKEDFPIPLFDLTYILNDDKKKEEKFDKFITIDSVEYDRYYNSKQQFLGIPLYVYNTNPITIFNLSIKKVSVKIFNYDETENQYDLMCLKNADILTSAIPEGCKAEINLLIPIKEEYKTIIKSGANRNKEFNVNLEFEYKNKHMLPHSQSIVIHCRSLIHQTVNIYRPLKLPYLISVEKIT